MSQNLSLFHAELLEFIHRESAMRIEAEGYDPSFDSRLRMFQNSLRTALASKSENDLLPLSEIVEDYQYLFDVRGPLYPEKKLIDALSSKEAKEDRIRVYRGLPRVYKREHPADSRLKKPFVHLPTLKKLAAEKAIFKLYSDIQLPQTAKVSLFTWVIGDGWGDYIAGMESIEVLRRRFADLQLGWVVLFPRRLGSPPVPKGAKTHLIYYDQACPISAIQGEALEILRTSDLVLQIPTFYPSFDALCKAVEAVQFFSPPPKWISIGEYGFLESQWFHPQSGNRSMGLHFLEKGILIKPTARLSTGSFTEIENHELLHWMFHTSSPGPQEIEKYQNEHHFYLAYLTSPIGGAVYLHSLTKALEADKKGIDLCCPDIGWLIRHLEAQTQAGLPVIEFEGISVDLYFQGKVLPLVENAKGKKIRIFCPSSISPADFHLLIQLSGEWIAIRGTQSFTEAVSANKAFFFDGRKHSRYFLKDLLAFAENRIGMHRNTLEVLRGMAKTFLHNLPLETGEWVEETDFQEREPWKAIAMKMGAALQDPDCLA